MGYATILLDAVVATRPRVSERAVHFDVEFNQADGSPARIRVVANPWNEDLKEITRRSRVLIGGQLRCGSRPTIVAGKSAVLWLSPVDDNDRAPPRVHAVNAHWRALASGRRIRIRAHVRGHAGISRTIARALRNQDNDECRD